MSNPWKKRFEIGDAVLYLGDCREILPTLGLDENAVAVTDPPYGISYASGRKSSWQNTVIAGDASTDLRDDIVGRFRDAIVFGTWKTPPVKDTKGALVWDKGPACGMGDLAFPWKGSWELIYVNGNCWRGHRGEGVLRGYFIATTESQGRRHPNEKPVSLIVELLKKLPKQYVVVDSFMGGCPTGAACIQLSRRFIGIEIDPGYFGIACRRITSTPKPLTGDPAKGANKGRVSFF